MSHPLHLPANATLADLQTYVRQLEHDRGFSDHTLQHECLLLGEEVGELFKAIRKHQNLPVNPSSHIGQAPEELADILIYLCAIANRLDINLEQAFRDKEAVNQHRTWRTTS